MTESGPSPSSLYTLYSTEFNVGLVENASFDLVVEAGGKIHITDFVRPNGFQSC